MPIATAAGWASFLSAMTLVLVRLSAMAAFAPVFSNSAFPARVKAVFVLAVAFLLAPVVAGLPRAHTEISFATLLGEVAAGLVYGVSLALFAEMLGFAGQVLGLQFSFSTVNLLDPTSPIDTPLLSNLLETAGLLVLFASGLDRVLLASVVRSFGVVPVGTFVLARPTAEALVSAAGGIFLSALELAAPVLAATLLIEIAVALLGKLSPQLPVLSLSVPLKTLTGFAVLIATLALWPRFLEARFTALLDLAQNLLTAGRS